MRTAKSGFSLLELLVAISFLSFGLLGLLSIFPIAHEDTHVAGQRTKARFLAQQMLENIRNTSPNPFVLFNGIDGNGVDTRNPSNFPLDDVTTSPRFMGGTALTKWSNDIILYLVEGGGVTGGWGTVTVNKPSQPAAGLHIVTVTSGWRDSGRDYSIVLRTLLVQ
jgi:type II secretory pathway pseudopilin PulG